MVQALQGEADGLESSDLLLIHTFLGLAMTCGTVIVGLVVVRPSSQCLISLQYLCQATLYGIGNQSSTTDQSLSIDCNYISIWNRNFAVGAGFDQRLPWLRAVRLVLRFLPGRLSVCPAPVHSRSGAGQTIRSGMDFCLGGSSTSYSLRSSHHRLFQLTCDLSIYSYSRYWYPTRKLQVTDSFL